MHIDIILRGTIDSNEMLIKDLQKRFGANAMEIRYITVTPDFKMRNEVLKFLKSHHRTDLEKEKGFGFMKNIFNLIIKAMGLTKINLDEIETIPKSKSVDNKHIYSDVYILGERADSQFEAKLPDGRIEVRDNL